MTITRKITIFICIALPVLLVSVYTYIQNRKYTLERIYEERRNLASLSARVLDEKLDRVYDLGISFSTRPVLRQRVDEHQWDGAIALMKQVPQDFPYIVRVFITDTNGTLFADIPSSPTLKGRSYTERDWYKFISKKWQPYLSEVYKRAEPPYTIVAALALPIKNETGNVRGILVLQIDIAELLEWSKEVSIGSSGYVYVVDHKGHVAANPQYADADTVIDYSSVPAVQKALNGEKNVEVLYNPIVKEYRLSAYEQTPKYGWAVIVQQEANAALADVNNVMIILAIAGILLITFSTAYLITREMDRRKKAEEQLKEYEHFFNNNNDLCGIANTNGYFESINTTFSKVLGYTEKVFCETPFIDLIHPDDVASTIHEYEKLKAGALVINFVNRYRKKDGSYLYLDWNATPNPATGKLYCVARDITERKKAEEQLLAANKELDAFSYSVSHDLRAPLRAIDGYSQMLFDDYEPKLDDEGKRFLRVISENTKQMGKLIDDLLSFSRLGRKEIVKSSLMMNTLVQSIVQSHQQQQQNRNAAVILHELHSADGDATLIQQVWMNLISNAFKYSHKKETPHIEIGSNETGNELVYYVKDNGAGFDMQYANKLFGVFQRLHTKDDYEGTGVGLAIVQRIIHRHGGNVWAEGEIGKGATFYFSLPKT